MKIFRIVTIGWMALLLPCLSGTAIAGNGQSPQASQEKQNQGEFFPGSAVEGLLGVGLAVSALALFVSRERKGKRDDGQA